MEMNEKKRKSTKPTGFPTWNGRRGAGEGRGGRKSQNQILLFLSSISAWRVADRGPLFPCGRNRESGKQFWTAQRSITWSIPNHVASIEKHMHLIEKLGFTLKEKVNVTIYMKKIMFILLTGGQTVSVGVFLPLA